MQGVVDDTFKNIVNAGLDDASAKGEFKKLIQKYVALAKVAKQLLVTQDRLDAINQAGLMANFEDFIAGHLASIYANQIRSGSNAKVTVGQNSASENDPVLGQSLDIVTTHVETSDVGKVKVEWYVLPGQGIVDAKVDEKFRMSLTLKPQYVQLWKEAGGNAKTFMDLIQKRLR